MHATAPDETRPSVGVATTVHIRGQIPVHVTAYSAEAGDLHALVLGDEAAGPSTLLVGSHLDLHTTLSAALAELERVHGRRLGL
jgi:hypothetical protein